MDEVGDDGGWAFVAETDGAAALLETVVTLEPGQAYTRSELAEAAGVALKTLYLAETVERLADLGVLRRVDGDDDHAVYEIVPEAPVFEAAARFEAAVDDAQASGADAQGTDSDAQGTDSDVQGTDSDAQGAVADAQTPDALE